MAKKRYLFFDIDGTLAAGGYGVTINGKLLGITPINREKVISLIRECESKNIPWGLQVDNSDTRVVPDKRFEDFTHDIYMKSKIVENLNPQDYVEIYKACERLELF